MLPVALRRAAFGSRRWHHPRRVMMSQRQTFRSSAIRLEEEDAALDNTKTKEDELAIKLRNKMAARDFNNRRAAYRRQVSKLRREYADEVAQQRAADKAEKEAMERELTRRRLERQRRKNIRSARNAVRQKELREEQERKFNEHLEQMQIRREAEEQRYMKARQLVVDELEEVAHLWLTTPEEVEAAFTPESEQLLWAYPGGILGEPNPSLDAHFWQYETHTWHMDRTYKSQREVLLEHLEEMAYNEANVDKEFWSEERLNERKSVEEKARLRAMVMSAGRAELLRKQKQLMEEQQTTAPGEIPKPVVAPSNRLLRNERAQEREGARLLMDNPANFFVFENSTIEQGSSTDSNDGEQGETTAYSGPALGSPVGLRDRLREKSHQNQVFPTIIGKLPKPDTRTEREKKQQEREDRMWAAAQAAEKAEDFDIELASQQQTAEDLAPDLDYNDNEWDSDDEEWTKGLDPVGDKDILFTPRENRYTEEDIDWVLEQLGGKVRYLDQQFKMDMQGLKQRANPEFQPGDEAVNEEDLESALLSLSEKELLLLSDLDDTHEGMSPDEFEDAIQSISLTRDQIMFILKRDRSSETA